jgi:hypothetical protein
MRVVRERQREKDAFRRIFPLGGEEKLPARSRGHGLLRQLSRACRLRRARELLRQSITAVKIPPVVLLPEFGTSRISPVPAEVPALLQKESQEKENKKRSNILESKHQDGWEWQSMGSVKPFSTKW